MLRLLDRAPQLTDATAGTRPGCECANAAKAKSYVKERFLSELETIMK
jgi:hypothetical protein